MTRIIDTIPAFEAFAGQAGLEGPLRRDQLWREVYEAAHPDVFAAFHTIPGMSPRPSRMVKELSAIRRLASDSAPIVREVIEQIDPVVREVLDLPADPSPVHVIIVGTAATNAVVGRMGDDVAVFHCLEWFRTPGGARILTAHETTHAWQLLQLAEPPEGDPTWTAFSEGLAIQVSRAAVPDQKDEDYFWYGLPRFGGWLDWCREHRVELRERLQKSLDDPSAAETMFDGTPAEGPTRVGYFVADEVVGELGRPVSELVRLPAAEATAAIRSALSAAPADGGTAAASDAGEKSA